MAQQAQLKFGSLVLCSPSDGLSGYKFPKHKPPRWDAQELTFPGAGGRLLVLTGRSGTEATAKRMEYEVGSVFADAAALDTFIKAMDAAAADTRNSLRTVTYGYPGTASSFSETHCAMAYDINEHVVLGDGKHLLLFTVVFVKVGV